MKPLRIHYLQHVPFEGLGYIETWVAANKHILTATKFYESCNLPDLDDIDWLIVLGGPMGVYDEDKYNWLATEKQYIKKAIDSKKMVLGICLGAQLIAHCLGAAILPALHKEIGWFPVANTNETENTAWFNTLFLSKPKVFHWHGDQFEIPPNATPNLLISAANKNQAFCYKNHVIGLQFHLEVTNETIELMLEYGKQDLINLPYIQAISDIKNGVKHIAECNSIMSSILHKMQQTKKV